VTSTTTVDDTATRSGIVVPGILLGLGLGGFVDGIVLHQIFQWHHMLTDYGTYDRFPGTTVGDLEDNSIADGLFHLSTLILTIVGLVLLWGVLNRGTRTWPIRALVGLLLLGWGMFNLVEGVIDHHVLTVHHVRDDVADPLLWDLGFLAVGAALCMVGGLLYASSHRATGMSPAGPR
jgi:uncharacterized membrane protein